MYTRLTNTNQDWKKLDYYFFLILSPNFDETPICQDTLENIEYSDEGGLDESGDGSDEELILINDDPNAKGQKTLVDYAESDEVSDSDSTGNTDDTDSSNSDDMEDADNTHCNLSLNISSESEIDEVLVEW